MVRTPQGSKAEPTRFTVRIMEILSITIAGLAAAAAFASVWLTRQAVTEAHRGRVETGIVRHLDRLNELGRKAGDVRWSAHAPPFFVGDPLVELDALLQAEVIEFPATHALMEAGRHFFEKMGSQKMRSDEEIQASAASIESLAIQLRTEISRAYRTVAEQLPPN